MRKEEFCEILGNINETYIKEAHHKAKKPAWLKWGAAAACLCLVVGLAIPMLNNDTGNSSENDSGVGGEGSVSDGVWPEGVDPVTASLAVIPAGESLLDVADATSISINEADAKNVEHLGDYLPDMLPDGVRYGTAGYYETTMKDGMRYHMIRVTYERGIETVVAPVPENAQAASEITGNTAFVWMIWGHHPDTNLPIYQPNEVTAQLLKQQDGRVFYIDYNGIYVGVEQLEIGTKELLTVIDSVG